MRPREWVRDEPERLEWILRRRVRGVDERSEVIIVKVEVEVKSEREE